MTEDRFQLTPVWRRVVLIGLVLIAGPAMAWSAIWFTRTYVVPSRVPAYRPMVAAAPTPAAAPVEQIARVAPSVAATNQPYKVASVGNEVLPGPGLVTPRETTASIARVEQIPLPRPKPRATIAAVRTSVPLPRPRPAQAN